MNDLEKAARLVLEAMGLIGADFVCDAAHHKKADRHGLGEPCPIQARWHHAFSTLLQALEQPAHHELVDWEAVAADQAMTIAMMKLEQEDAVRAEREECAKFFDDNDTNLFWGSQVSKWIRERNQ